MDGAKSRGTCKSITIKLDCKDYPADVPRFSMKKNPEKWNIRADEYNHDTDVLRESFAEAVLEKKLKRPDVVGPIIDKCKITDLAGETVKSIAKKVGDLKGSNLQALEMHHLRPSWASGSDRGDNLAPVDFQHHRKSKVGVHSWWRKKLKEQSGDLNKQIDSCAETKPDLKAHLKKEGESKGKKEGKKGIKLPPVSLSETNITALAGALKSYKPKGVDLYVEMDCEAATHV